MENDKSLVSLLAESLVGAISSGKKMNRKHVKKFYLVTRQLSETVRSRYGRADFNVGLSRYMSQRAMLTGMKDNQFVDEVCKAKDLNEWEDLMFYKYA